MCVPVGCLFGVCAGGSFSFSCGSCLSALIIWRRKTNRSLNNNVPRSVSSFLPPPSLLCVRPSSCPLFSQQIEFEEVLASRVKAVNNEHKQKLRAVDEQTKQTEAVLTQLRTDNATLTAKSVAVCVCVDPVCRVSEQSTRITALETQVREADERVKAAQTAAEAAAAKYDRMLFGVLTVSTCVGRRKQHRPRQHLHRPQQRPKRCPNRTRN